MYERRYTNVEETTTAMATETITFPSQSGSPPGFLHINAKFKKKKRT